MTRFKAWRHERNAAAAAGVARAVSRKLREAGFEMSKKKGRREIDGYTDGLVVGRVGYSNDISVHARYRTNREKEREVEAAALEFLRSAGYAFDERLWLHVISKDEVKETA